VGLFSKDPSKLDAKAAEQMDKARAKAAKRGVDVSNAIAVGSGYFDDADHFLVIHPDRVDLFNMGKTASLLKEGRGVQSISVERISSAQCNQSGIYAVLSIAASGTSMEFKCDVITGPVLCKMILEQVHSAGDTKSAPSGGSSITEQLRQLAELHSSGVLTDAEFSAKKADLLDRM
jgi:hypothetical protein